MTMKERYIRYLSAHYRNSTDKELTDGIAAAIKRVNENTDFSTKVLIEVIDALKDEGYTKAQILAHLNMIDLEYRT